MNLAFVFNFSEVFKDICNGHLTCSFFPFVLPFGAVKHTASSRILQQGLDIRLLITYLCLPSRPFDEYGVKAVKIIILFVDHQQQRINIKKYNPITKN